MSEHAEQEALFQWADKAVCTMPDLSVMYAIPNAAKRSPRLGAYMKAEGLRAGVPDICLPVRRHGYNALYIELKAKGGRMRISQTEWQQRLNAAGNLAVTCVGWSAARETIENYLRGDK